MKKRTREILERLRAANPDAKSELKYSSVYELAVAVILSAQCTDKRVNEVTPKLFELADTPQKMLELGIEKLEEIIHPCGFFRAKAAHIMGMSLALVENYGGNVPADFDELQKLPGIGRKTANVIMAVGFNQPAIAVDTHVFRVSNRLGIVNEKDVLKTELALRKEIDKKLWADAHHWILLHGRYVCKSQKPRCENCIVSDLCEKRIK